MARLHATLEDWIAAEQVKARAQSAAADPAHGRFRERPAEMPVVGGRALILWAGESIPARITAVHDCPMGRYALAVTVVEVNPRGDVVGTPDRYSWSAIHDGWIRSFTGTRKGMRGSAPGLVLD